MRRYIGALAILIGCVFAAPPLFAQDIVKLNEEGIAAFQEGRFEEAAQKFSEAYAIEPEQTLKKNEALAWFKAAKCDEALTAADEYLALQPTDELSIKEAQTVVVKCNIQTAQAAIDAGDIDGAEKMLAKAKAQNPDEESTQAITQAEMRISAKRKEAEDARNRAAAQANAQREAEAAANSRARSKALGLGLLSGGGALIVGTLVYHMVMALGVAPNFKEAAEAGDDRDRYDKLGQKLETANWLVPSLYAVGFATAGVGVYFWLSGSGTESNPDTQAATATGRSFGIGATWRF